MAQTIVAMGASMETSSDGIHWETIGHTGIMDMSFSSESVDSHAMASILAVFNAPSLIMQLGMAESTPEYTDEVE